MHTTPDDVLDFWLGAPATNATDLRWKIRRWFRGAPGLDDRIRNRFGATVEAAAAGQLDAWADTPRGLLALVILLDQFTRNVYRNDPRAFAADPRARALTRQALARGDEGVHDLESFLFLHMPLGHSEDVADHDEHIAAARRARDRAPAWARPVWEAGLEMARRKREGVARFGRFPHRNAILGRTTTDAEAAWLQTPIVPPAGLVPPLWRLETTAHCGRTPFVRAVLAALGLPWEEHLVTNGELLATYGTIGPILHEGDTVVTSLVGIVLLAEERAGLAPADPASRAVHHDWAEHIFESIPKTAFHLANARREGAPTAFLEQVLAGQLSRLDGRLAASPTLCAEPSVADHGATVVGGLPRFVGVDLQRWPRVATWAAA